MVPQHYRETALGTNTVHCTIAATLQGQWENCIGTRSTTRAKVHVSFCPGTILPLISNQMLCPSPSWGSLQCCSPRSSSWLGRGKPPFVPHPLDAFGISVFSASSHCPSTT